LIEFDAKARKRIEKMNPTNDTNNSLSIYSAEYTRVDDNNHVKIVYRSESNLNKVRVMFDIYGDIEEVE